MLDDEQTMYRPRPAALVGENFIEISQAYGAHRRSTRRRAKALWAALADVFSGTDYQELATYLRGYHPPFGAAGTGLFQGLLQSCEDLYLQIKSPDYHVE